MDEPTQVPPPPEPPGATPPAANPLATAGPAEPWPEPPDEALTERRIQLGLACWFVAIVLAGIAAMFAGHPDAALLLAGAGAFALAQASDAATALARYRSLVHGTIARDTFGGVLLRTLTGLLVPGVGAFFYVMLGFSAWGMDADHPLVAPAIGCWVAAALSLALASRRLADAAARAMFGGPPTRTRRLTARVVVLLLLLPGPGLEIFPRLIAAMRESGQALVTPGGLVAQLAGELAIGCAGVGWLVRRDLRGLRERLGLGRLEAWHLFVIAGGVLAAFLLNAGGEVVERAFFPALFKQDNDASAMIAAHLPLWTTLLLGVAAGFGEEIPLRGALQPRAGVLLTSIVFACGHVQYSWFGMLIVALLGVIMGTIRARTNTTVAIAVHALYDILAVLSGH